MMDELFARASVMGPGQFVESEVVETRQAEGLRSEARARHLRFTIDEPTEFGGTDSAPNPAEVALAALGASLEVTCRVFADYMGIPVERSR